MIPKQSANASIRGFLFYLLLIVPDFILTHSSLAAVVVTTPVAQIVTLRAGVDVDGLVREFNLKPSHVYRHALNGFAAALPADQLAALKQDGRILAVEPDGQIVPCAQTVPNGILRMGITNFPVAHIKGLDNRISVDVAVLDTGIQTNHPDLNVVQAVGFADAGLNGDDWNGHGTHIAGIIGALDNDFGVVGVAPGVRLWSVQVIGPTIHTWSAFIAGMDYIFTNSDQIAVVNASLTGFADSTGPYMAIHQAVSNVVNQGILFVAAAGNDANEIAGFDGIYGTDDDILPAALPEVMAVSAMNPTNDTMADFSNGSNVRKPGPVSSPGFGIDVAAPGVGILSTWKGGTNAYDDGTSMAAAHVSGLVALYVAANGRGHNLQDTYRIRQAIIDTAQVMTPNPDFERLAVPSETWVPVPNLTSESKTPQGFGFSFTIVPGYTYTSQYLNSLSPSNQWTNLTATNGSGSATTATLTDPTSDAMRLYRVARQPTP